MPEKEFPGSIASDVLSGVIDKLIPPKAYTYLFAALPGFFFEISILIKNPGRMWELVTRAQDGFGLNHYELVAVALILAFVIGNAFMLLVAFNRLLLGKLYLGRLNPRREQFRMTMGNAGPCADSARLPCTNRAPTGFLLHPNPRTTGTSTRLPTETALRSSKCSGT